jgi:simple sugar transport system ATP-binding protein
VAGTADPKTTTRQELANLMVGRDVELIVPKGPAHPGEVVLSLSGVTVRDDRLEIAVDGVDLEVRAGEIVVIAGVQGNGQTELVEAIAGLRSFDAGTATISGHHIEKTSPRHVSDLGVAHIPEDRGRDGLINTMTVAENYILDTYHRQPYSRRGVLHRDTVDERAAQGVKEFDIRTPSIDTLAGSLSGGNQQKVVVAREFSVPVKLVLAAQPTRGLDVGSIEYIHRRLVEQRDAGAAILIVSTELDEVIAVGDRIAVMFEGKIVGIVSGEDATYEKIGLLMGGAHFGGDVAA